MSTQRFRVFLIAVAYYAIVFSATWFLAYYSLKTVSGNSGICFFIPVGWCEGTGPPPVWLPAFQPFLTWIGLLCIVFLIVDYWRGRRHTADNGA